MRIALDKRYQQQECKNAVDVCLLRGGAVEKRYKGTEREFGRPYQEKIARRIDLLRRLRLPMLHDEEPRNTGINPRQKT